MNCGDLTNCLEVDLAIREQAATLPVSVAGWSVQVFLFRSPFNDWAALLQAGLPFRFGCLGGRSSFCFELSLDDGFTVTIAIVAINPLVSWFTAVEGAGSLRS